MVSGHIIFGLVIVLLVVIIYFKYSDVIDEIIEEGKKNKHKPKKNNR